MFNESYGWRVTNREDMSDHCGLRVRGPHDVSNRSRTPAGVLYATGRKPVAAPPAQPPATLTHPFGVTIVAITAALLLLATLPLAAQTQITTSIGANQATNVIRIAIPFPDRYPSAASAPTTPAPSPLAPTPWTSPPPELVNNAFFGPLTRDLASSGVFAIAALPPNIPASADLAKSANAQLALKLNVFKQPKVVEGKTEEEYVVEARLLDTTGASEFGKRYRGSLEALTRISHTLANDLVRSVNGKPGIFLSQIAFASNRDGHFEIYLMDWDGENQRRITFHNALSILPSWSPDNERMVYTSFAGGTSNMYIISRRGGGRIKIHTGLNLNTSATFSPVGNDIAFVGSVAGNPDIYVIKDDGTNLRRLTSTSSIESTPEWSPNGRQISFTSGRSGTPQIYIMDAEGTNVRRVSFEGEWNDDATWSPDGERIAYTSRVNGRFQIRVMNVVTGESTIVAGEGSNEQPTWSPDGLWIAFQSNRSGVWQIYRIRLDGTGLRQLTNVGENKDPDWSKKGE
jgi:TolB protein